jgi:putative transcription factor
MSNPNQDWTPVTLHNPSKQKTQKTIVEKRGDQSESDKMRQLDNDTENFAHQKIPSLLCKEIITARTTQKLTQKEMATKLNVPANIYNDIENGRALYNPETKKVINKLENLLKIRFQNKNVHK